DWNCDGEFSTADLVAAFTSGGYVAAALPDLMNEPLPTGFAGVRSPNETNSDSQLVAAAWRMHVDQLFAAEDDRPVRKASAEFELSKSERAFFA
ncbi:MAG: hypothetical protein KDA87_19380, partial [Planctomycetales bacterium]|nr:hypothetical protein [Planctomycetales bacterium]